MSEPSAKPSSEAALQPKRRRRWPRRLAWLGLGVLILIAASVALAPTILSNPTVTRYAIGWVNSAIRGKVEVGAVALAWVGRQELQGLRVMDAQAQEVLAAQRVSHAQGIWSLIWSGQDFGVVEIDGPQLDLRLDAQNKPSLMEAFEMRAPALRKAEGAGRLPSPRGRVVIRQARVSVSKPGAAAYELRDINAEVSLDSLADVALKLTAKTASGPGVSLDARLTGLVRGEALDVTGASGDVALRSDAPLELGPLAAVLAPELGLEGAASVQLDAKLVKGAGSGNFALSVKELKSARATQANPLELSLKGSGELKEERLSADVQLSGAAGVASAKVGYGLKAAAPINVEKLVAALLAGESFRAPEFELDAKASIDLAALERAVPGLLKLQEGRQVASGKLEVSSIAARGGEAPSASGALELSGLEVQDGVKTFSAKPIRVDFDAGLEPGQGLNIRQANLQASFATVTAKGTPEAMTATLQCDLAALRSDLGQAIEFGASEMSGSINGEVKLTQQSGEKFDIVADLRGQGLRYVAGQNRLELPAVAAQQVAALTLSGKKPSRLEVTSTQIDLNGEVAASGRGWLDFDTMAFSSEVELSRADLAFLGQRAGGIGGAELARYGGAISAKATAARGGGDQPVQTDGSIQTVNMTLDGKPFSERDVRVSWSGAQLAADFTRVQVQHAQVESALADLTVSGVKWESAPQDLTLNLKLDGSFELAKLVETVGRVARMEKTPAIAGKLTIATAASTAAGAVALQGQGVIDGLSIGGGGDQLVRQERVQLEYDARFDQASDRLSLTQTRLVSSPLSATLSGTIDQLRGSPALTLAGRYDADWAPIMQLMYELAPGTVDVISVQGKSGSEFKVSGPLSQPNVKPTFRGLTTGLDVGWEAASAAGIGLGPAKLSPALRDGKLTLPVATIAAAGGLVRLGGEIDFTAADPTYALSGNNQLIEKAPVNRVVSELILSRLNPIFLGLTKVEGQMSLLTQDIVMPFGESAKARASGQGQLKLKEMKIQPGGFLSTLLAMSGYVDEEMYTVEVSGCDFVLREGRIRYDDFTIIFPPQLDLKFRGSVGLDDSLDLIVSVPISAPLLEKFGVQGPVLQYAKDLAGVRIDIPLGGTRQKPVLDPSKVDLKPILEKVLKKEAGGALENILQGLSGGEKKGASKPPAEKPADKKKKKPAGKP